MGVNLILRHKRTFAVFADLGRAYRYDVEDLVDYTAELKMLAAYAPRSITEMHETADNIDHIVDEIKKLGAMEVLDIILRDGDLELVKE